MHGIADVQEAIAPAIFLLDLRDVGQRRADHDPGSGEPARDVLHDALDLRRLHVRDLAERGREVHRSDQQHVDARNRGDGLEVAIGLDALDLDDQHGLGVRGADGLEPVLAGDQRPMGRDAALADRRIERVLDRARRLLGRVDLRHHDRRGAYIHRLLDQMRIVPGHADHRRDTLVAHQHRDRLERFRPEGRMLGVDPQEVDPGPRGLRGERRRECRQPGPQHELSGLDLSLHRVRIHGFSRCKDVRRSAATRGGRGRYATRKSAPSEDRRVSGRDGGGGRA